LRALIRESRIAARDIHVFRWRVDDDTVPPLKKPRPAP
jgi:hypothetical protein